MKACPDLRPCQWYALKRAYPDCQGRPVLTPGMCLKPVASAEGVAPPQRGARDRRRPSADMMIPVLGLSQDRWPGRNLFGFAA